MKRGRYVYLLYTTSIVVLDIKELINNIDSVMSYEDEVVLKESY